MRCPFCRENNDKVIDSRSADDGRVIRRRRHCEGCGRRFTTYEHVEDTSRLWVIKKDGNRVPYDRQKILAGLEKSCYKRPVNAASMTEIGEQVEEALYQAGGREVESKKIGQMVAERLKQLDHVAYVRFASVYKQFRDLDDFLAEVREVLDSNRADQGDRADQGRLF